MTKKQNRFWVSALVLRENVHLSAEFLNTKVGEFFPLLSGRMSSSLSECTHKKQNRVFFCSLFYGTNVCWIFMLGGERVWWKIYRLTAPWHESLGGGRGGGHILTHFISIFINRISLNLGLYCPLLWRHSSLLKNVEGLYRPLLQGFEYGSILSNRMGPRQGSDPVIRSSKWGRNRKKYFIKIIFLHSVKY